MNTEEHDDLWHLLGKAREPVPSAFFSRNVLRAIREEQQEKVGMLPWLRSRWQFAVAGACFLAIVGFVLTPVVEPYPENTTVFLAEKMSQSTDFQVIINFDELLASEESAVWLEN